MNPMRTGSTPTVDAAERSRGARPDEGIARATGALLILATAAGIVADAVEPGFTAMADNPDRLATSVLLRIVAAGASVGIAISLYPVLRRVDQALATGAVVFRTLEAVMYLIGVVVVLSGLPLSEKYVPGAGDRAAIRLMIDSSKTLRESAGLVAVFAFAVGALMYYWLFYRAELVPRWLSVWGLLAVVMIFVACLVSLFGRTPITDHIVLAAPIFLQEIVLGVWLLVKGFNSSEDRDVGWSSHANTGSS